MSANSPTDEQTQPRRGLICVNGEWRIRRAGFRDQRELTCFDGHHFKTHGQFIIEGIVPCGHKARAGATPCSARLYLFRARNRIVFAMDLTEQEDQMIELKNMDLDDIIEHFGISFHTSERR